MKSEIRRPKSERSPNSEARIRTSNFGILSSFVIRHSSFASKSSGETGSTFIIVLWIAFGLVSLTLYFASSMSFELHAADNRVCGLMAEQAIDGAARYVNFVLASQLTNGTVPDPATYQCQAAPVGDSHFWIIGRGNGQAAPDQLTFALVDEASKLNLNWASSNMLFYLPSPPMTSDLVSGILDWRSTNGVAYQTYYATQRSPYQTKNAPFESVDELRLVYGASLDVLIGGDANRNGAVDENEKDASGGGLLNAGLLEYVTADSWEPNTNHVGTARVNLRTLSAGPASEPLHSLLQTNLSAARANAILARLNPVSGGGGGGGRPGQPAPPPQPITSRSPLDFYVQFHSAPASLTADEFAIIATMITVTNGPYIQGRVNINTASLTVLACLPGINGDQGLAQTLVSYREANPDKLGSVAWVVDALGKDNTTALNALRARDCLTTESYQFTADVAAIGPHGRGYRRTRFIFDTADGTPKIIYRQDLSHLGWALGKEVRQTWVGENALAGK